MIRNLVVLALAFTACQSSLNTFPSDAGSGLTCGVGTTACDNVCVNLEKDTNHCGSCTRACGAIEGCAANKCYPRDCTATDCASTQLCDQEHCREAACLGVSCPTGQACFEGRCWAQACGATVCRGLEVCVAGRCIDPSCVGITCPQGSSCRDGQCLVEAGCVVGATCAPPSNLCHVGAVACDGGTLSCLDQNLNVTNGTSCGDGGVCNAGVCTGCAAGRECPVVNPCHIGRTSCAAGVESCVDSTVPQANGTSCGAGLVCVNGSCATCAEDAGCQVPNNPCTRGVQQCANGPTCADTQQPLPAGTTCGADAVCSTDGGCNSCRANVACAVPGLPCREGRTSCATGEVICLDTGPKTGGTFCDGGVCDAVGACLPCSNGSVCAPTDCSRGVVSCGTGGATCGSVTTVDSGVSCPSGVCVGPTCVPCIADGGCSDNGNGCRVGVVQCSASGRACLDGVPKALGASCSTGSIDGGVCDSTATCIASTRSAQPCTGLPANAAWNTATSISQTWTAGVWLPTTVGAHSTTASTSTCVFACNTNYTWSGSACVADTRAAQACTGLPANASWNTATSITQTWNGSAWSPSTAGSHSTTASTTTCVFACNTNYTWSGSACVADTRSQACTGLPANASWNTASSITQTWSGTAWGPSTAGSYGTTPSTTACVFQCNANYSWSGSACVLAGVSLTFSMDFHMGGAVGSTSANRFIRGGRTNAAGDLFLTDFTESCCSYASGSLESQVCSAAAVRSTNGCWFTAPSGGTYPAGYPAYGRAKLVGNLLTIWTCGLSSCTGGSGVASVADGTLVGSVTGT